MKNGDKVINFLIDAFPGHRIETTFFPVDCSEVVYFDGMNIGSINKKFFEKDFDNPEIEIKVKAPLYKIKDFLEEVECDGDFYHAVERGLKEWEEGLPANN